MTNINVIRARIAQYEEYIRENGSTRGFSASEVRGLFEIAKQEAQGAAGLQFGRWELITNALMYGYMKGYRRAVKDTKESKKAPRAAATTPSAGPDRRQPITEKTDTH